MAIKQKEKTPEEVAKEKKFWANWGRKNQQRIDNETYYRPLEVQRIERMGMNGYVDSKY